MKILYISYDYYKYDGRGRELINAAKELGDVVYITRDSGGETPVEASHILYHDRGYLAFILFVCRQAKKSGGADMIFIDNRKGIIPGFLAKRLSGARYVVQDCRELYDMKSAAGIPGRIGCVVERIFTRRSDVAIAANAYRARIMVRMFGLKTEPLNYENIRRLTYSSEEKRRQVEAECGGFFKEEKFRIVSTSGCDMSRTTGQMLKAMKELGSGFELLLIGDAPEEDELIVRAMIREEKLGNVKIFPQMDQERLKYFIGKSQVGMVAYHQRDLNNKYCASGKIFEFLYEGKPVVTSTNPPLREFCKKHHTGISSDDYAQAIRAVAKDYGRFQASVQDFIKHVHVEDNNHRLAGQIRKAIKGAAQ